jgi:translation initiation factor IF-3
LKKLSLPNSPTGINYPRGKGADSSTNTTRYRVNEQINAKEVRVVDEEGTMLGVMTVQKAIAIAEQKEQDVVEIAPQATPPVVKIIDFGKFQYEIQKKEKHQRKQQQQQQMKEIRFKWRTATHDFNFKMKHAREFIGEGNKVKASVMFRGREITHQEIGRELLDKFVAALEDIAKVDQMIHSEGKTMSVVMAPEKQRLKLLRNLRKMKK